MRGSKVLYPTFVGLACGAVVILGSNISSGNGHVASAASVPTVAAAPAVDALPHASVNARGQSYGSELTAADPSHTPDLILAYGKDGTLGYVKKIDFLKFQQIAPAASLNLSKLHPNGVDIPLYASDGFTLVGSYHIDP